MEDTNSYIGLVQSTLAAQLVDCSVLYPGLSHEFDRDLQRLNSALEQHGIQFALVTMPAFRKHLDRCLSDQRLTPSHLTHFGCGPKGSSIPRLFRGLTLRVFEQDGRLKDDPDVQAIRLLRQLLGVVRKLRLSCPAAANYAAVASYVSVDESLPPPTLNWLDVERLGSAADISFGDIRPIDRSRELPLEEPSDSAPRLQALLESCQLVADILFAEIGVFNPYAWRFRHGPGAVADQRFGEYKYSFSSWPDRLEAVFPFADFAFANYGLWADNVSADEYDPAFRGEIPARLCCVPKTLSKPRLIACEPTALQWCQQAVRDFLYTRVQETLAGRFISFRDQRLSADLALQASRTGELATIDLSDASDRVSCWLVERLTRRSPTLRQALGASRSAYMMQLIDVKSPRLMKLRKFSSMGNATTFPVESLAFLAAAIASVLTVRGASPSRASILRECVNQVRVFGDDIIIPSDAASVLTELLEALYLKVNTSKSFSEGNFREACGVDAYRGHDVSTVSVLDVPRRARPATIASTVDVHKNLCERGYVETARVLRKMADRWAKLVPVVEHGSDRFGWSDLEAPPKPLRRRWNESLSRLEVRVASFIGHATRVTPDTNAGLLQYFTERCEVVTSAMSSIGHLDRRPSLKLRAGWAPSDEIRWVD